MPPREVYYISDGGGVLLLDGVEHDVHAGSSAFFPGEGEHAVRNSGTAVVGFFDAFAHRYPLGWCDRVAWRVSRTVDGARRCTCLAWRAAAGGAAVVLASWSR